MQYNLTEAKRYITVIVILNIDALFYICAKKGKLQHH